MVFGIPSVVILLSREHIVGDALIQPYSGFETRQSLEIYSKLSLSKAQDEYDDKIKNFPA